ncbi:class I SAM-dependent methyltransferase [Aciditerrimonas ferrireducens]|uniref:class I SAM-dependent methyltransferase n=1 Tax=Aciditerrimonas ferrireducens TaxID=667306 RepID=UPI00200561B9|nr:class I SAM-dependent methyltransferase [Aciditerrimonas ferrireducens]MCK4178003.1 class I SAM-dependent methyltransferase [Aciditerrimonas ferrireducens]
MSGEAPAPEGAMWDERFAQASWPTEPDPLLVEAVADLPPGRALDLGSGPGRNGLWLAQQGWQVTLLDASRVALEQATARAAELRVTVEVRYEDAFAFADPPGSFELVVVANLHPGPERLPAVLDRAATALVPGGHLFVVGHDLAMLGRTGPPDPERLLTVERLVAAMPSLVRVERVERRRRPPDHGGHGGLDGQGEGDDEDLAVVALATRLAS